MCKGPIISEAEKYVRPPVGQGRPRNAHSCEDRQRRSGSAELASADSSYRTRTPAHHDPGLASLVWISRKTSRRLFATRRSHRSGLKARESPRDSRPCMLLMGFSLVAGAYHKSCFRLVFCIAEAVSSFLRREKGSCQQRGRRTALTPATMRASRHFRGLPSSSTSWTKLRWRSPACVSDFSREIAEARRDGSAVERTLISTTPPGPWPERSRVSPRVRWKPAAGGS